VQELNFPTYQFRRKLSGNMEQIFDPVRKKWVKLTSEEWVRQNLIRYLNEEKRYPIGRMQVEKELMLNTLKKRSDLVIYDKTGERFLLAECKAPEIKLSSGTFEQAARYNLTLKVPYLFITNGLMHYCAKINFDTQSFEIQSDLPLAD